MEEFGVRILMTGNGLLQTEVAIEIVSQTYWISAGLSNDYMT